MQKAYTRVQRVQPELGSIPDDASVVHINIEPFYCKQAACLVHSPGGTALMALLGDSLVGVSFLSGWGLNSAFQQIAAFEQALIQSQKHCTNHRNTKLESLWLSQLGQDYHYQLFCTDSPVVKQAVVRTLAVVGKFNGTKTDLVRSCWNEKNAVLVSQMKFGHFNIIDHTNSMFGRHNHWFSKQLAKLANHDMDDMWIWPSNSINLGDLPSWKAIDQHSQLALAWLASAYSHTFYTNKTNRSLQALEMFALYNQEWLRKDFQVRTGLNQFPNGYLFANKLHKYDYLKTPKPHHKQIVMRTKSVLACFASTDLAWHIVRQLTQPNQSNQYHDILVFMYCKQDFSHTIPVLPVVLSTSQVANQLPETTEFDTNVHDKMHSLAIQYDTLPVRASVDTRVLVLVDQKYGRPINHLLSILDKLSSTKSTNTDTTNTTNTTNVLDVYLHTVGNSALYK